MLPQPRRRQHFRPLPERKDQALQLVIGDEAESENRTLPVFLDHPLRRMQRLGADVLRLVAVHGEADLLQLPPFRDSDADDVVEVGVGLEVGVTPVGLETVLNIQEAVEGEGADLFQLVVGSFVAPSLEKKRRRHVMYD
jgi:hypothetical protein